jgi:hypothetical protein
VYKEKVMKHSIEIEKIESVSKIGFLGMTKSIYKAQAINRVQRRESTEQCWEWKRKQCLLCRDKRSCYKEPMPE